jgi:DSF synthase
MTTDVCPESPTTSTAASPEVSSYYDARYQLQWIYMQGAPRSCFTPSLLKGLQDSFEELSSQRQRDVRYAVLASTVPGVYNLGGDLDLFRRLIAAQDRSGLLRYATACIDALHLKMNGFRRSITHLTLVQGDALGGGFECALAADVLVAERHSKMGLPEVLFNLFPGMGAYSILSRKIGPAAAQRVILSGKLYYAEELFEMGVVDLLAEPGEGEMAVYDYIRNENRARNAFRAVREVRDYVNPIRYEELIHITEIWVDAALQLEPRDLRMMERLVARQTQKALQEVA